MNKLLLSILMAAPFTVFSQLSTIDLPITWDDATVDYTVAPFGNITTQIIANPTNASDDVLEITKPTGAPDWAGVTLGNTGLANPVPFTATETTVKVKVWSAVAGAAYLLKVEDDGNGGIFVETTDTTTTSGAWEWLEFDFSNPRPNAAVINLANTYDRMSIFPNFGVPGSGNVHAIDSVYFVTGSTPSVSNVTFRVDMNNYTGFTIPEVNGDFNGWCGNCNPMTDADMDGVWEVTLPLTQDSIEFKYSHDSWAGQENFSGGEPCTKTTGGFTNRFMHLSGDTILPISCWNSCTSCSSTYDVTFQVDMNQYAGSFTTPEVNGQFNGWCGNCNVMTDADMDGIWEVTLPITADSTEYKFSHDNWTGQENFVGGEACTKTDGGFTNRFVVLTADTVLPPVCWESCAPCTTPPTMVDVTFQVDMSQYTANTYTDVHLNGTFNGWCGTCAPMADADNDSIYELTISLPEMDTVEFKFTLDGWTFDEQFAGGESCTKTSGGFTNRMMVPMGDTTMPAFCWESCDECETVGVSVGEYDLASTMTLAPNPAKEMVTLRGVNQNSGVVTIQIFDIQGKVVYNTTENQSEINHNISLSEYTPGIYFVNVSSQTSNWTEKLIINQ